MTERWVIHLPVTAPDLLRARIFARAAARVLARLSARVEPGGVTVSAEDQQGVRHWVFCDRPLAHGRRRCALSVDHTSACEPRPPWPRRR
ncbi:hypothetical protein [Micromonospora sp. NPDC005413]|uniref:hypothetical protein n=1 Tax=Micromonospora sp. NPDC005413 TaxID=3154563 RepID=UPI0033A00998